MFDEAHIKLSGKLNKQSIRYYSSENPKHVFERPLCPEKVSVWCGMARFGIIGLYFLEKDRENTVTNLLIQIVMWQC